MLHHKPKRDSPTADFIQNVEVEKTVGDGGSPSRISHPSSPRASLTKNPPTPNNGSGNVPNVSSVYAVLREQGERTDRVLDLFHSQTKTLEHYGESMMRQYRALEVQGELLKTHGDALVHILKDHQKLRDDVDHVEKIVGTHSSILKQHEAKLKVIKDRVAKLNKDRVDKLTKGRVDKVPKGHRHSGNPRPRGNANLRRSSRLEARTQQSPTSSSSQEPDRRYCGPCGKFLDNYFLCKHML